MDYKSFAAAAAAFSHSLDKFRTKLVPFNTSTSAAVAIKFPAPTSLWVLTQGGLWNFSNKKVTPTHGRDELIFPR